MDSRADDYLPVIFNNYLDEGFNLQLSIGSDVLVPGNWISIDTGQRTKIGMRIKKTVVDRSSLEGAIFHPSCTFYQTLKILETGKAYFGQMLMQITDKSQ